MPVGCERPSCGQIAANTFIAATNTKIRLKEFTRFIVVPFSSIFKFSSSPEH